MAVSIVQGSLGQHRDTVFANPSRAVVCLLPTSGGISGEQSVFVFAEARAFATPPPAPADPAAAGIIRATVDVIHYPDDPPPAVRWSQPVVALGNFDGVHRGHAKILDEVRRRAEARRALPAVLTFDPHPSRVLRPDRVAPLLMTTAQKLEAFEAAGMAGTAIVRFTSELSQWDPERFVRTVLVEWLQVGEVCVGSNFLFGRNRSGNFSSLRDLGAHYGFEADKVEPVRYKDFVVSSTRLRRLVADGRVDEAGALLGHHHIIDGTVEPGDGRGRGHGIPTANLRTANELLPADGVYATTAMIDGMLHPSVTNIGVRPTFGPDGPRTIETHLLDDGAGGDGAPVDLYGQPLRLAFVQRIRDERTFEDAAALRRQIDDDCAQARTLFRQISL